MEDKKILKMYDFVRLPENHYNCRVSEIPDTMAYKPTVVDWFENIVSKVDKRIGLYINGPYGTGKSAIAAIILKVAAAHGIFGLWINMGDLHDYFLNKEMHTFDEGVTMWDRARDVPILVIDEVDIQQKSKNPKKYWGETALENLIRHRTRHSGLTILTSNHSPAYVKTNLPGLATILTEATTLLQVNGFDQRAEEIKRRSQNNLGN